MKMIDGKMVPDDTPDVVKSTEIVKETVSKFNMTGRSAEEAEFLKNKALADLANQAKDPIESFKSNPEKSDKLDKVINILNHAESIIKLIAPHFTTHVDRIKAEKKIRNYFDTKE